MAAGDLTATRSTLSNLPCNVFDGVDDYVEVPHAAQQLGANLIDGFTISAWINPRSAGEDPARILDKSTGTNGQAGFRFITINASKCLGVTLNAGSGRQSATNSILFNGVWKHVLITISNAQLINFYVDGTLSGTANQDLVQGVSAITTTNAMRIGNRAAASDLSFDGGIAKVKMWNRVLSAAEIAQDYAGNPPTFGLIHYFKLNGDYTDYGSVGVAATNSGSYAIDTLANQIKADIDKLNNAATTDNAFLQVLTNFERMDVVEVIKVVRA